MVKVWRFFLVFLFLVSFNSLAFALSCPIVGTSGDNWQEQGIDLLISGKNEQVVVPDYGADANISSPKK